MPFSNSTWFLKIKHGPTFEEVQGYAHKQDFRLWFEPQNTQCLGPHLHHLENIYSAGSVSVFFIPNEVLFNFSFYVINIS